MAEASATLSSSREIMAADVTPAMTPEDRLCLLLARGQLSPELQKQILESLASPVQWPLVLQRAYQHQVYPLLYRNLRDLGFPGVPDAVQAELKRAYLANALRKPVLRGRIGATAQIVGRRWDTCDSAEGRDPGAITLWRRGGPGLLRHRHSGSTRRCGAGAACHPQEWDTPASSPTNFSSSISSAPPQTVP